MTFDTITMQNMGESCIYTEKLNNARIVNFACDGVDNGNNSTAREGGIRLNLKAADFENITLEKVVMRNVKVTGIKIQPRDDCDRGNLSGSCGNSNYASYSATLKSLPIIDSTIENNLGGIRIGLGPYRTVNILTCLTNPTANLTYTQAIAGLVIKRNRINANQDTTIIKPLYKEQGFLPAPQISVNFYDYGGVLIDTGSRQNIIINNDWQHSDFLNRDKSTT